MSGPRAGRCHHAGAVAQLTLASLNARWGYDVENRPFDLERVIADLDTDVVVLQEVWEPNDGPGAARRASDRLGYSFSEVPLAGSNVRVEPRITRHDHEVDGWWGLAVLSRVPDVRARSIEVGRRRGRFDVAHRQALVVELPLGGARLTLVAVHLSFVPPNAIAQLARLRQRLRAIDGPLVVVGDFNLPAPCVLAALRPARPAVRGKTFPARGPIAQLDHLLVQGGATATGGAVNGPVGSDHLPIVATIRVGA